MAMWVYREGNQNKPPVNEQQMVELIKSGVITGSTYVCDSDTRKWILASNSKFAMLIKREEALRQQQQQQFQQSQQNRFIEQQPSRFVEQQPNQVRNTGNKGKYITGGVAIVAACVVSFIAGRATAPKGVADVSGGIVPPTEVHYENQFVPELDTSVPDDLMEQTTESVVESTEESTETVVNSVFSSSGLDGTTETDTEQESLNETTPETETASESETSTEETVGN